MNRSYRQFKLNWFSSSSSNGWKKLNGNLLFFFSSSVLSKHILCVYGNDNTQWVHTSCFIYIYICWCAVGGISNRILLNFILFFQSFSNGISVVQTVERIYIFSLCLVLPLLFAYGKYSLVYDWQEFYCFLPFEIKKAERKVEKMGTSFIQYRRSVMLGYSFSTHLLCSPFKWWKTNQVWQVVMVFNASFDSRLFFHISIDQSALFREIENWMNYIIVCVKGYFYGQ